MENLPSDTVARKLQQLASGEGGRPVGPVLEEYLEQSVGSLPRQQRMRVLDELITRFRENGSHTASDTNQSADMAVFFTMILGRSVEADELQRPEVRERLKTAFQDIFNGLNRLLQAIDDTMGKEKPLDRTIRQMVHGQLADELQDQSLSEVIEKIRRAFLTSYEASKSSHQAMIEKIITEMNPERILQDCEGSLRLGPLRKAEAFESYRILFNKLSEWHVSGRGLVEYLNTFEHECAAALNTTAEE